MTTVTLHTPTEAARWLRERVTGQLHADSRQIQPGDGFIAWPGAATDGRRFVAAALAQGASACLVEQDGAQAFGLDQPQVARYPNLKADTGPIAAAYHGAPSQALQVLAVTGTNGKTSTAWWMSWALSKTQLPALAPCALVGTLGVGLPGALQTTGMTTPDPVLLQRRFRELVDAGVRSCAIEASSIGIAERRLDGTAIRVAVFTNFTQDHLDYHGSMQAYWQAKAALFDWPGLRAAVIQADDPRAGELVAKAQARGLDTWTVARGRDARLRATNIGYADEGLQWVVREGAQSVAIRTALVGDYNIDNLMGVLARCGRWACRCPTRWRPAPTCPPCPAAWSASACRARRWRWWTTPIRPTPSTRCCRRCARWRRSAADACGACSAVAATAMPASAR